LAGVYEVSLTIPANTAEDAPVSIDLEIEGDVVTKVEIDYPSGPARMVGTAIFYGIEQLWPAEAGTWFYANNYVMSLKPEWDMPERKVTLTMKGCSPNTSYDHTIGRRVHTADMPAAKPWKVLADFILILKRLIGV